MAHSAVPRRRLVFLTVNSSYSHSSLALPLLHQACRDLENWEFLRYDMTIKEDVLTAVQAIDSLRCDLLAADLYLFNSSVALEVLQRCHALAPQCRIAVGGPECLGDGAEELLKRYPFLDCVFRGEGEEIFRDYLEHFDDENPPLQHIVPAEGNGIFEAWSNSGFPVDDPFFVTDKPFVQMETSRGCPMKCFYCTSGGTLPRYRSLEQVRAELTALEKRGVRELRLLDRTFNLPQERGTALLKMFREEFPGMKFHLELHPQFLNDDLRHELGQALPGQLHIEVGIQCLDQKVQDLSGRRSNVKAALEGLTFLCSLSAFETHADLLAGLPGQTLAHIFADTDTLMNASVKEIQLEVLKVLPGTPLRQMASEYGLCYSETAPYDVMKTHTMSLEEIQTARDLSHLLDMTWNHRALHASLRVMHREQPGIVLLLLEFFRTSGGSRNVLWDLKKRFLFLSEYCSLHQLKESAAELACHWLLAGLPPGQGADTFSENCDRIPEKASLCAGDAACLASRETRCFRLEKSDSVCFFAFNRSFALNLPAAVWKMEK